MKISRSVYASTARHVKSAQAEAEIYTVNET